MILVTGSRGLIGSALVERLTLAGHRVRTFDIADEPAQTMLDQSAVAAALAGVDGIVHLAAVSRVVWAQNDPDHTWALNVDACTFLIEQACVSPSRPWIVFGSSREVYGEPDSLPVPESAQLKPMNIYARSKVAAEQAMARAATRGTIANVARFSNVYGSVRDYADRVVPAFARATANDGRLRLEGPDNMFDFTHIDDVARGLHLLIDATAAGRQLDPVHFVTGHGTTLRHLSAIANAIGGPGLTAEVCTPRSYDVARFTGDPERAAQMLDWRAEIDIETGFRRLVEDFRAMSVEQACSL